MPVTFLHYPVALGLSKISNKLSLPGLIVGSFIPDIEVPFLIIFFRGVFPDHFILHSLIGAVTIGTFLTILVTRFLYPPIVSKLFKLDKKALKNRCSITYYLILSCLVGNVFHIFLDVLMHTYNPILWPWVNPNDIVGPLVLLFSLTYNINQAFLIANILTNTIMGIIGVIIILIYRNNLWESLLI